MRFKSALFTSGKALIPDGQYILFSVIKQHNTLLETSKLYTESRFHAGINKISLFTCSLKTQFTNSECV